MMGRLALALALVAGTSSAQYFAGGGAPLTPAVEQALMHGAAPVAFPFDPPALPAELQARQQQQQVQAQQPQQQQETQPRFSEVQQQQQQPAQQEGAQYADPRLRAEQEQLAVWGREYAAQQQQGQEAQAQEGQQAPVLLEQPQALSLPPADAVMQAALVETAAKAKGPAAATEPLAAKGIDLNEADAVEDATTRNQTPPRFTTNTASSDSLPQDSTMQAADDHAAPLTPLTADAQADPAAEPRFAQSKAEAEDKAPTPIVGAAMASSAANLNLVSGIPPAPGQPIPNAEAKRCKSVDGTSCAVKWSRGDINWSTRTVPEGSLKEEMKTEAAKLRRITAADRAGVSSESGSGLGSADFVMSNNPEIAAKQKAYVDLHKQLSAEYDWVRKVRAVIRNYQNKVFNVQSHLTSGKAQLYRMKDDINKSIRKVKQDRLKYELKAAVDALAKLENHASALDAQAKDISASKNSLRATVAKIKLAMGRASNEDFTTQMRFQEQVLNKLPSQNEVKDAMRFAEANSANEDIKQAMSSLLQILDAQKPGHEDPRHAEEDEHELAAARSLPSPALIESRARAEDKAEAEAEAQTQAQAEAPVVHIRSLPVVHHKVYAVPHVAPPDTDLVGADVDPAITREELNRQYEQVVRDTEAESDLE